jgi:hypothetical protein
MNMSKEQKIISHPLEALNRWENGHHVFIVLIQSLVVVHLRLGRSLERKDWRAASDALADAALLWRACCAAFHFTGDFTPEAFETIVRPSMAPPHENDGFSGTWSADHAQLLKVLRGIRPLFQTLPPDLSRRYRVYKWDLDAGYESHSMVCGDLAGSGPSLKMKAAHTEASAVEEIRKLKTRTLKLAGYSDQP